MILEIILGFVLAGLLILFGRRVYPEKMTLVWQQGLVIAALVYVAFAVFGQNIEWVKIELVGVLLYGFFAWLAYKRSVIYLSIGWALHVFWDLMLHPAGHPEHVPDWYPGVCLGFDLLIAGYFLWYYFQNEINKKQS